MTHYITYTRDSIGNNYLTINITDDIINPYLDELKEILGEEQYQVYIQCQHERDRGRHHITVINFAEYSKLSKEMGVDKFVNSLEYVLKYEIDDLKLKGIGTAEAKGNRTYFIVVDSEKLEAIRDRYELSKQDFHITIGFYRKDVFGVRKNEIIN